MREAGFVFWGLFVAFAVIVALYVVWMLRVER
jgi:hypothetical protein